MTNAEPMIEALAEPMRREILERLLECPRSVTELADGLPVTRPAVSQHLQVLKQAGLVSDKADGRRRVYQIDPKGLGQLRAWLDKFWESALGSFQAEMEREFNKDKKDS